MILWTTACASSRRLTASVDDYERYRAVRLATNTNHRLGAAYRYLQEHPNGEWHREVERWFNQAEPDFLTRGWDSIDQLEAYLLAVPNSHRSQQARLRIAQLRALERQLAAEEQMQTEADQSRHQAFEQAKGSRKDFLQAARHWAEELAECADLGQLPADWSPRLHQAFFDEEPKGACEGDHCEKLLLFEFGLPVDGKLQSRPASISVELTLVEGRLAKLTLGAPRFFDRLSEASTLQAIAPGDLQGRAEAVATAIQILGVPIEGALPGATCEAEAVSPVVLRRQCEGKAATLVMGQNLEVYGDQPDLMVLQLQPSSGTK